MWFRTCGSSCRNALRIRETFHCCLIVESLTNHRAENPHPDPLPSDGRGKAFHVCRMSGCGLSYSRVQQFSLSRRMREGRGERGGALRMAAIIDSSRP
jgi:hypothetical protein